MMREFKLDERIAKSTYYLYSGPLSDIYLKDAYQYPWLLLVPRQRAVEEIFELMPEQQVQLISEISIVSAVCKSFFKADKINIAALGNVVAQLHVHIVARFKTDEQWPEGLWHPTVRIDAYTPEQAFELCEALRLMLVQEFSAV